MKKEVVYAIDRLFQCSLYSHYPISTFAKVIPYGISKIDQLIRTHHSELNSYDLKYSTNTSNPTTI